MIYYKHIDGLRALAVISVLFVHLNFSLFSGGYVGVDIFFVISGFLITNIIVKELESTGKFSFLNFYIHRIKRILPALIFTLTISFIFSIWLLNIAKFNVYGGSLATAAISFSNIFFYKQAGYFDAFSQSSPLLHTWSLGVEEQFYIFWPISLLIVFKINKKLIIPFLISTFVISLGWSIHRQGTNLNSLYYLVQFRVFEFSIGASLVWFLKLKTNKNITYEFLFLIGLVLISYSIFTYGSNTLFPSYNALPPVIGSALLIYAGTAQYFGYILRNGAVRFIGLISYSLYLIHWPIIVFVQTYYENIGQIFTLSITAKILILIASIFIATLMYYFIEQPFRKNIPKEGVSQIKFLATWFVIMLVFVLLGVSIFYSKGWLWRSKSPQVVDKIDNIAKYHQENWGGAGFTGEFIYKGKNTYPDIVMMGDSHSGMLDTGMVNEIAKPNDLTIFTVSGGGAGKYSSTLLLPGITRIDADQNTYDKDAHEGYKEAIEMLLKSKESVLIYSADYSFQLNKAAYLNNHESLQIDTAKIVSYNDYKPFINALDRLRTLMKGHKLILRGNTPGALKFDAMDCLAELKWWRSENCQPTQKENMNIGAVHVNNVLQEYASQHQNVYFINPYDIFCKNGYCMNLDKNGIPFYSDNGHLSKTGSTYFIRKIKNKIIKIDNNKLN